MKDLKRENLNLQRRIKTLMHWAEENEGRMRRIQELQLEAIRSISLESLFNTLIEKCKAILSLDDVTLAVIDEKYDIRDSLLESDISVENLPGVVFFDSDSYLSSLFSKPPKEYLGKIDRKRFMRLFPQYGGKSSSVALLPLASHGKLLGSINLRSFDENRYRPLLPTDFLVYFSSIASLCLENVLYYEMNRIKANTDVLTGVKNRAHLDSRLPRLLQKVKEEKLKASLLLLDIDFFKKVNDTYGHQSGDLILREFAQLVKEHMGPGTLVARYGGEEFCAVITGGTFVKMLELSDNLRKEIEKSKFTTLESGKISVTTSIGICQFDSKDGALEEKDSLSKILKTADEMLYIAKSKGRNRIESIRLKKKKRGQV